MSNLMGTVFRFNTNGMIAEDVADDIHGCDCIRQGELVQVVSVDVPNKCLLENARDDRWWVRTVHVKHMMEIDSFNNVVEWRD